MGSAQKRKDVKPKNQDDDGKHKSVDDETIQSYVYQKAKRLGYGLRIIPKVKEFFFGKSSNSKYSKTVPMKSEKSKNIKAYPGKREKRKPSTFGRPSRQIAHVKMQ